jgi:hypothetical protein
VWFWRETPIEPVVATKPDGPTANGTEFDHIPLWRTLAVPLFAPEAIVATTCVSLQLTTTPFVLPSQTLPLPCAAPNPEPMIVTGVPAAPEVGERLVTFGTGVTVNKEPLLLTPPTFTTKLPVFASVGTVVTIDVSLQIDGAATAPLKLTALVPCAEPKFAPAIVTVVPTGPLAGETLVIEGGIRTVNVGPCALCPPTWTVIGPLVAAAGTGITIWVSLQFVGVAAVPLKVTVLVPCATPKFAPVIVTGVPITPEAGERLAIAGEGTTVKATPLLAGPFVVTTILPDDAPPGTDTTICVLFQVVDVATTPLNVIVPCVEPNPTPCNVTTVPTGPIFGVTDAIVGALPAEPSAPTAKKVCGEF